MIDKSAELLAEIVQCPNITSVLTCNLHNPCEKVVRSQGVSNLDYFQVPEPWLSKYRGEYDEGYEALRVRRWEAAKKVNETPAGSV